MATTYLSSQQLAPAAATLSTLYTVPSGYTAVVSSLIMCNTSASASDLVRVSVAVGGAADNVKQYIYGGNVGGGLGIAPNDTFVATLGITLAAGDVIRVYSQNGTTAFNLFLAQVQ